jgi:ubiquinone/menaquinone biosynthesis C-methylase UbiE
MAGHLRKAADRLVWTVETMAVRPADRVLEIGCGHGVAVTLVCEQLTTGSILAIDRSATMIEAASRRNAEYGNAGFQVASLHEAELDGQRFDKILAIHLPVLLRGEPDRELAIIRDVLAPGGQLFVSYQPLDPGHVESTVDKLTAALARHGMVAEAIRHELPSGRIVCVRGEVA